MSVIEFRKKRRPRSAPTTPQPTPGEVARDFEPGRISQARELRMLNRRELAEQIGVTRVRLINLEMGISEPKPHEVIRLAEVLDVPVAFFRRGRPFARIDSGDVFMCAPRTYGPGHEPL